MKTTLVKIAAVAIILSIIIPAVPAQDVSFNKVMCGNDLFLKADPVIRGFKGPKAVVEFETVKPVSGALIYYGTALSTQKVGAVYYRKKARERSSGGEPFFTTHRVLVDVSYLEKPLYDSVGLIEQGGGTVYCRIEAYDPASMYSRFHDFRFRYRRQGVPKTGVYSTACTLTEGPMVDCVTPVSAIISWWTDRDSRGRVVIDGAAAGVSGPARKHEVVIDGLKPDTRYSYRVEYDAGNGVTETFVFRTAPPPGSRKPFSFGFMSDGRVGVGGGENAVNGVNIKVVSNFSAALDNLGARFIVFGGDLINGYTSERYSFETQLITWKKAIGAVGACLPTYEALGNHEMIGDFNEYPDPEQAGKFFLAAINRPGEESSEALFARHMVNPQGSFYGFSAEPERRARGAGGPPVGPSYDENVYSFHYGNAHFTVLNSNYWPTMIKSGRGYTGGYADKRQNALALKTFGGNREGYIRENQLAWLARDLAAAQRDDAVDCIFVIFHEPPFPNGGHLLDAMFWGESCRGERGGLNDASQPLGDVLDMRDRLMEIVCAHRKVVAVMCGDEHNYSRMLVDGSVNSRYRYPVWQIISGGVGAPYYSQDKSAPWADKVAFFTIARNYCLFSVEGKKIRLMVFAEDGRIVDHVKDLTGIKKQSGALPGNFD